ncbi:MAG: hypothetical protein COA67_01990 [Lutibacter sp.]|nr:MAG: hypothetical protein COA67_01990 [Lutibacter sp.]
MSKKLHILFLSSWYPSRIFPTNGDFVQRHAETVASAHKVTLVHIVTDKYLEKSIEIKKEKINNVDTIIVYVSEKLHLFKFFIFFKTYLKIIKQIEDFDLVHLNVIYPKGLIALYLKIFKRKKYIITEHWTEYQYPLNKSIGFLKKILIKLIVNNAEYICPISNNLANDMQKFGLKGNYNVVPNVVDTSIFFPIETINKIFTIVNVSNLFNKQKNITGLLNVIEDLSKVRTDFMLKLVGNDDFKEIKSHIKKLKIPKQNIQLIESQSQEGIAKILQEANVYVSFSNYESFGLVMTESIAVGTPVISTNTGILTEIDATEFSTIIPINNQERLLKSIIHYMDNVKKYDSQKMHDFIKIKYSKTIICKKFTELYLKTLR